MEVGETGKAVPGPVRTGRPRSRGRHSTPRWRPYAKMALHEERDEAVPVSRNQEREKAMVPEELTRNFQALEKRVRDIRSYL